jgi:YHS domain-containing protein
MEGLFSLLLFAAAFYVMMRFGCGAHMVHGHGGHKRGEQERHTGHPSTAEAGAVDPVCGMEVAPDTGYTKIVGAHAYRFCSRACLDTFEKNP